MLATTHTGSRLWRDCATFFVGIAVAIAAIALIWAVGMQVLDVLTFCGLILAIVGGCTKVGSP